MGRISLRLVVSLAVFALAALGGVACSTNDGAAPACDQPTKQTEVDMENMAFAPACISATANDTLNLVNKDSAAHTFTVKGTSINVSIHGGQTATAPLTGIAPGTYSVTCQFHPQMTETLQVT
jgi:plastocyanin